MRYGVRAGSLRILLFALVLCAAGAAACASAQEGGAYSRVIDIEGIGSIRYYAQNDPVWARSIYEDSRNGNCRTMMGSGCGPTAAAMALARQLTGEELARLNEHTSRPDRGFPFCTCSVNELRDSEGHTFFRPVTGESFIHFLPVIIASYATGNNDVREKFRTEGPGTSYKLFRALCGTLGLQYEPYGQWEDVCAALERGESVITTVTKGVFTTSSHYLLLAGVTGGYLYILDPFMRESYPDDKRQLLELVEPGLVRVRLEDVDRLGLSGYYAMRRGGEP